MPGHPNTLAALQRGAAASNAARPARVDAGLAFARAWRERMRPVFDAMYGAE